MATDTSFGEVRKFEDFLVTAIADLPEIDELDDGANTNAVVSSGADGRLRLNVDNGNDDDRWAVSFGALNWTAGTGSLKTEARIILNNVTDNTYFVGFSDNIATGDETIMTVPSDVVTTGTASDSIGFCWDGDATTAQLWAVAQNTDVVTASQGLGTDYNPVAATPITLGVHLSIDRKTAIWSVNGKEVYRLDNTTALVAAVALVPIVQAEAQATAFTLDVDYLYACKGRSVS